MLCMQENHYKRVEFWIAISKYTDWFEKIWYSILVATLIVAVAFCIGLSPFNNKPTIYRVIVEGVVYYIGVAIMEEIYLRGLLQNIIEKWFGKRDNATLYAVIISSALFGLGIFLVHLGNQF